MRRWTTVTRWVTPMADLALVGFLVGFTVGPAVLAGICAVIRPRRGNRKVATHG